MLPASIISSVDQKLASVIGTGTRVTSAQPLSGGDINRAFRLQTTDGTYFLKYNLAGKYPGMFQAEARGLALLNRQGAPRVPKVFAFNESGEYSWLLLEYIEQGSPGNGFWESFGVALAQLHKNSSESFGLDHDNYIGSLPQSNRNHSTWHEFFIEERLNKQLALARNKGLVDNALTKSFENLFNAIPSIFPKESPSLVHGDLWSGNYLCDENGNPCIIDPAVYYGFREMDIGMSQLFGGFASRFYESYQNTFPMAPGWPSRIDICNLYPLLVHVNLFGGGYLGSVKAIAGRF
ncbi:MAG: fructosamine kinase family protein [Bacteroidales bacterium]